MSEQKYIQKDLFGGDDEAFPAPPAGDLPERMLERSRPDMIRVAPDRAAWVPRPGAEPDQTCLCRWVENRDGTFHPVPFPGRWCQLTPALAQRLGFRGAEKGKRYDTILRLARAGYIDVIHISPGVYQIDLDSWFRHVSECASDPGMWEEGSKDRNNYLRANGLGGWRK